MKEKTTTILNVPNKSYFLYLLSDPWHIIFGCQDVSVL